MTKYRVKVPRNRDWELFPVKEKYEPNTNGLKDGGREKLLSTQSLRQKS